MPFLKKFSLDWSNVTEEDRSEFPFNIEPLQKLNEYTFTSNVTFFMGDNGSGKSTLLEAIGASCGFSIVGGRDLVIRKEKDDDSLSSIMRLSWLPKVTNGFYFRAETFDTFANYIDELARDVGSSAYRPYGGKSLNEVSHGQGFLTFFTNRFASKGIYILDEPESALSPQNQLAFLRIIWELEQEGQAQFIIATHSPILLAYPGAKLLHFSERNISEIEYEATDHYNLTRDFLNNRERYFRTLFVDD
ncbi:ABC transporter ATP-binding protein [Paenibacillus baekrokdamisoli]|uniref:ABC transporter ATP-binding protein n=1 Tax=Paenibacillus baekrokdamisoli TaxID=1712516 RepID=A0A3G9JIR3_9BACL|nr:AAA family ATPase [Paenibacillus baekrokdamisoli]MBB3068033.1 putative ATPase [Paenibacillus baekrokdamisoli]BBH22919.1 ABC transporter ATP-binding protein [Paenibacillus baekrokdamisoli]